VGGFVVTDRMLLMFRAKPRGAASADAASAKPTPADKTEVGA
jgi:hypothetical protein